MQTRTSPSHAKPSHVVASVYSPQTVIKLTQASTPSPTHHLPPQNKPDTAAMINSARFSSLK